VGAWFGAITAVGGYVALDESTINPLHALPHPTAPHLTQPNLTMPRPTGPNLSILYHLELGDFEAAEFGAVVADAAGGSRVFEDFLEDVGAELVVEDFDGEL